MTSRGPGRASRSPEMEEKEQLRRQIRLLQGLIDDYKTLHGNAPAPCTSAASRWQPPVYPSSRSFTARYPRPSRRGFAPHHGPAWRKKYSLVNRPPGATDLPGDQAAQPALGAGTSPGPDPQPCVLERQVQLSPDQNMVIKIKPPPKPDSTSGLGAQRHPLEECEGTPWSDQRPQEGEGEPPGGKLQPSRPGRVKDLCSGEDPLLVCQKEPGKPRVVRSVSSVNGSPPEPRRTVSEGTIEVKTRIPSTLPQRSGGAPGRKVGLHSAASCATQLLGDGRVDAGRPDQPALLGLAVVPARATPGPRQAREASRLVSCRTSKFREEQLQMGGCLDQESPGHPEGPQPQSSCGEHVQSLRQRGREGGEATAQSQPGCQAWGLPEQVQVEGLQPLRLLFLLPLATRGWPWGPCCPALPSPVTVTPRGQTGGGAQWLEATPWGDPTLGVQGEEPHQDHPAAGWCQPVWGQEDQPTCYHCKKPLQPPAEAAPAGEGQPCFEEDPQ
nr:zinc finger CCCH domain-containing protein 3 [Loxodonta africana]